MGKSPLLAWAVGAELLVALFLVCAVFTPQLPTSAEVRANSRNAWFASALGAAILIVIGETSRVELAFLVIVWFLTGLRSPRHWEQSS